LGNQRRFSLAAANKKKSLAAAAAKNSFQRVESRRLLALLLLPHREKKFLLAPQSGLRRRFSVHPTSIAPLNTLWVTILLSICSLFERGLAADDA
jgi:hypothetical protein